MKRYLVPYEGSSYSKAALRYAIQFAQSVPGLIDIRYIADVRLISNPIFDMTVLALQAVGTLGDLIHREKAKLELKAKLVAHGEELLRDLEDWPELAKNADVPIGHTTGVEVTSPPEYLIEVSENYDVIFLGLWAESRDQKSGLWGSTSEAVIRRGESPVLLAKGDYRQFDSAIVGFDNRPRSRQALAWAGMIGEKMGIPVTVITCGSDTKWRDDAIQAAREITPSYDTEFHYRSYEMRPADAIIALSVDRQNDLICLGAFGDQPLRELFLGSVAEEVLRRSDAPVMLFK